MTIVTDRACHHFDIGGEKWPPPVQHWCRSRDNDLFISHGDEDHIKFVPWAVRHLPRFCLVAGPLDEISARKKQNLSLARPCSAESARDAGIREITTLPTHVSEHDHNLLSRVYVFDSPEGAVLLPGDSIVEGEALWLKQLRAEYHIRILVLGHHGSRTSTGEALLRHLPDLSIAIASARKAKYGHPHAEVVRRLLDHHISVLTTEDYGHIAIRL